MLKQKFFEAILNKPIHFIVMSVLFAIITAPFLLQLKLDFTNNAWFEKDSEILQRINTFEQEFQNDETVIIAIAADKPLINSIHLKTIFELTDKMELLEEVYTVDSIINYKWVHSTDNEINVDPLFDIENINRQTYLTERKKIILADKDVQNYLISPDLKTALIIGKLRNYGTGQPNYTQLHKKVEALVADYKTKLPATNFHLLGRVSVNAALKQVSFKDTGTLVPLLGFLILLFLTYYFRNLASVVLPISVIALSTLSTMGLAGIFGMKMVSISFIIPIVMMAIGMADSIHVINIFKNQLRIKSKREALKYSMEHNFSPTLLTSVTTAIGFFSLLTSDLIPIQTFGLASGLGVLLTWLYTYFLLVPGLLLMKFKLPPEKKRKTSQFSQTYLTFITQYRHMIFGAFTIITLILIYNIKNLHMDVNPYKHFKPNHPLTISNDMMLKSYGGVTGPELIIDSGKVDGIKSPEFLKMVDSYLQKLKQDPGITNINSALSVIKKMNQNLTGKYELPSDSDKISQLIFMYNISVDSEKSLDIYISPDYSKLRLNLAWKYQSATQGLKKSDELINMAKAMGLNAYVTGKVHGKQTMVTMVISTFLKSISLSFVIVMLLMMIYLKSFGLGILAMIPNITPLAFASGLLGISGHPVDITVAVVSSICLGIAVDDTIHFLTKYTESRKSGLDRSRSLLVFFQTVAQSLILTTAILCIGLGVFVFSDFLPNRNFGVLSAGVLFVALITDIVLLPVLLIYVDKFFQKELSLSKRVVRKFKKATL